jgi:hypothetical protein
MLKIQRAIESLPKYIPTGQDMLADLYLVKGCLEMGMHRWVQPVTCLGHGLRNIF